MRWRVWFAWYPVNIKGRLVWLRRVHRRWNPNINFNIIDPYDPGDYDGGWEYKR